MENIKNIVESILFLSGDSFSREELCTKIPELTKPKLNSIIRDLKEQYSGNSGIILIEVNDRVQLASNPKYGVIVSEIMKETKEKELSNALLQVLAVIAYEQPITRVAIDDMRGTSSDYALSVLLKENMIEVVGRKDTVGHPLLYGTTEKFLKRFKLLSLDSLPNRDEVIEKLVVIKRPEERTLYHNRSILGEYGVNTEKTATVQEFEDYEEVAAADVDDDEFFDDEIPDFLVGEDIDVID